MTEPQFSRLRHYGTLALMLGLVLIGYSAVTRCVGDLSTTPDFSIPGGQASLLEDKPCPDCELILGKEEPVRVPTGEVHVGSAHNCAELFIHKAPEENLVLTQDGGADVTLDGSNLEICRPGPGAFKTVVTLVSDKIELGTGGQNRLVYIPVTFR
jgi:hypothetical protein